jgi:hypothetical protein
MDELNRYELRASSTARSRVALGVEPGSRCEHLGIQNATARLGCQRASLACSSTAPGGWRQRHELPAARAAYIPVTSPSGKEERPAPGWHRDTATEICH